MIVISLVYLNSKLPDVSELSAYKVSMPLRIYSAQKELIGVFGSKKRIPIKYDQIPADFINAIIAAEDARFASHQGIDVQSSLRAILQVFTPNSGRQTGASTITMQVARNYFLNKERTFYRKVNEILLAFQIEKQLSKQQILELYANKIYLGLGAYGIAAAAKIYYNQPLNELNISQLSMLAGLPKAPSLYNPIVNPSRSLVRRNWILKRMLTLGYIEEPQYQQAVSEPIVARNHSLQKNFEARYVAEMVRQKLYADPQYQKDLYTKGYKVYTTIDGYLQKSATEAVYRGLINYDRRRSYGDKPKTIYPILDDNGQLQTKEEISSFLADKKTIANIYPAIIYSINTEEQSMEALLSNNEIAVLDNKSIDWILSKYPAETPIENIFSIGELIRVNKAVVSAEDREQGIDTTWRVQQIPKAQAAMVAVQPDNGAILALTGGFSFDLSQFNRATQGYRQLGSGFKPFIYAAALTQGYSPASIVNDSPIVVDNTDKIWLPENDNLQYYGPIRLRQALYQSRNMVSIRLLRSLSIEFVRNFARQFGFENKRMPNDLSLSLGTVETTPLQVATAYSSLANGGYKVSPFLISTITDSKGTVLFTYKPDTKCMDACDNKEAKKILSAEEQYVLQDMLQDVIQRGTAKRARVLKRQDLAGKTGTTNKQLDAWFNGFSSNLVASVWVGFDQPKSLGEYASQAALPIWIDFMSKALDKMPVLITSKPKGVIEDYIDTKTGLRVGKNTQNSMLEVFQSESHLPQYDYSQQPNSNQSLESDGVDKPNQERPDTPEFIF